MQSHAIKIGKVRKPRKVRHGKVGAGVMENSEISLAAKAIFAIISCSAHHGVADMNYKLISRRAGVSVRHAKRAIRELKAALAIENLARNGQRARWRILQSGDMGVPGSTEKSGDMGVPPIQRSESRKPRPHTAAKREPRQNPLLGVLNGGRRYAGEASAKAEQAGRASA